MQLKKLPAILIAAFIAINCFCAKKITLEDIYLNGAFQPEHVLNDFRSFNDGKSYSKLDDYSKIYKVDFKTGKNEELLFNIQDYEEYADKYILSYSFSDDNSKILILTDITFIYRHSYTANYLIFDLNKKELYPLSDNGKQQIASFSPDSKKIGFVRENNIFFRVLDTKVEKQITFDGETNNIINGKPDWVYEEEFSFSQGFFWSPNSDKIAYYKFDESRVKMFNMTLYEDIYPTWYQYKYPKAGEENSIVSIHIYNLNSGDTRLVDIGKETNQYIPRIEWTMNNDLLCITRLNRLQNKFDILIADANSGDSKNIYTEESDYYISEINDEQITFIKEDEFVLWSEKSGYSHLYLYSIDGTEKNQITNGEWDVRSMSDYDPENQMIYYESYEDGPLSLYVYSISKNGENKTKITREEGQNVIYFNNSFDYYFWSHSSTESPGFVGVYDKNGKLLRIIEDNSELMEKVEEYGFTKKEFIKVPTDGGIELNGYIIKPQDFDPSKKYPLFMFTYGGPNSQQVLNAWDGRLAWFQYLAQQGYIVACIDNRGTGARGEYFKKCIYKQLGKLETMDQINAAKYFGSLPYIDETRIGIFGWSYGGYLTALCLTKGADVFKMGVAVALVANWRFYDSIYTERYLGLPKDNAEGYDENSPIFFVDSLKGKLLIMHGLADDNVHVQNAFEFSKALIDANKQFDMQIYPNKNHNISGVKTQYHLYKKMTDFILENL